MIKIINPNIPTLAFIKLVSKDFSCLEKTWARPKNKAIKLAKNRPKKFSDNFGSKKMITIPKNEVKINIHLFLLIFSLRINALETIPKGIANCEPRMIGDIIDE